MENVEMDKVDEGGALCTKNILFVKNIASLSSCLWLSGT